MNGSLRSRGATPPRIFLLHQKSFSMRHPCRQALLIVLCGIVGCDQPRTSPVPGGLTPSTAGNAVTAPSSDEDQQIELLLAGKDPDGDQVVPAEVFFAKIGQGYMIWKGEVAWFKKLWDDSQAAGSPAMHAVVSDAFGSGVQVAAQFVISMPTDPAARAKVIEAYNNFWKTDWDKLEPDEQEELKTEFVTDRGQKYLMLSYDP